MSSPQPNILQLAHQMADEMTKDDSVDSKYGHGIYDFSCYKKCYGNDAE